MLVKYAPGIQTAWQAEGKDAQLGVFHTGEELLSRKTGEAARYQALKARYGINPLDKIGVFANGGTVGDVGASVVSSIGSSRPRIDIDLSALDNRAAQGTAGGNKTINIKTTVITPDADSFRLNQDQRNQDLMEALRRGI
jgi:hypothetical protein